MDSNLCKAGFPLGHVIKAEKHRKVNLQDVNAGQSVATHEKLMSGKAGTGYKVFLTLVPKSLRKQIDTPCSLSYVEAKQQEKNLNTE